MKGSRGVGCRLGGWGPSATALLGAAGCYWVHSASCCCGHFWDSVILLQAVIDDGRCGSRMACDWATWEPRQDRSSRRRPGSRRYSVLDVDCMSPLRGLQQVDGERSTTGGYAVLGGLLPAFYLLQLLPQGLPSTYSTVLG